MPNMITIQAQLDAVVTHALDVANLSHIDALVYVAGGACASLLIGEEPVDYDLYMPISPGPALSARRSCSISINISTNAHNWKAGDNKIQLITTSYGEPLDVVGKFDFVHCTPFYCYGYTVKPPTNKRFHVSDAAAQSILRRELVVQNPDNPVPSILRAIKFVQRGWTLPDAELFKLLCEVSAHDLTSRKELKDLCGHFASLKSLDYAKQRYEAKNLYRQAYMLEHASVFDSASDDAERLRDELWLPDDSDSPLVYRS